MNHIITVLTVCFCSGWLSIESDANTDLHQKNLIPLGLSSAVRGICSTWGYGHFKQFSNKTYDFIGHCKYILSADCSSSDPYFSIQFKRDRSGKIIQIEVVLPLVTVLYENSTIVVSSEGPVTLPYHSSQILIQEWGASYKMMSEQHGLKLTVFWDEGSFLLVSIETQHSIQTCGLCGDFNSLQVLNDVGGEVLSQSPVEIANSDKNNSPREVCLPVKPTDIVTPSPQYQAICTKLVNDVAPNCKVSKTQYVISCQKDLTYCKRKGDRSCSCTTLSEYSRQCAMLRQQVENWRRNDLCPLDKCPGNQIYMECGAPCAPTCSNQLYLCTATCIYGCFCPPGTMLDDISGNGVCVPVDECPCLLFGEKYYSGERVTKPCRSCICDQGQWTCDQLPCPGKCTIEGGSFVTTFDSRTYRFHGICTYLLVKSADFPDGLTVEAEFGSCGSAQTETCLQQIICRRSKDLILISASQVNVNGAPQHLPYISDCITIVKESSMFIRLSYCSGLNVFVQLLPVFSAYIIVDTNITSTAGLCGTHNQDSTDDFLSSHDVCERVAHVFVDSWRLRYNCDPSNDRAIDPCSTSQIIKVYAESSCSILINSESIFSKCHQYVDPTEYYKRCRYVSCNYDNTNAYMCESLGNYARACAARGLILYNWRKAVKCSIPCASNMIYSYNANACNKTCFSLYKENIDCSSDLFPIEGCVCQPDTYLNHEGVCVKKSSCPCYTDNGDILLNDHLRIIDGTFCRCIYGSLHCEHGEHEYCPPPQRFFKCSAQQRDGEYGAACAPTCQMLATGAQCSATECKSGCICPSGLYLDGTNECVEPDECSCEFSGVSYRKGEIIYTGCQECECLGGKWNCSYNPTCPGKCVIYGAGHITTFDGKRYLFDGYCSYTLARGSFGDSSTNFLFRITVDRIICSKSGTACSRTVNVYTKKAHYKIGYNGYVISPPTAMKNIVILNNRINVIAEITTDIVKIKIIWNKLNIIILISRTHAGSELSFSGLCGNFNGNVKDDYTTRSGMIVSNVIDFGNSWKNDPACDDLKEVSQPCLDKPHRRAWAEKKCAIINSNVFAACHLLVYRLPFYDACVHDACGCEEDGDCTCLCDAIAVYAKACLDAGVCIDWRTPDFCPVYCDYFNKMKSKKPKDYSYNSWHYQPCLCPNFVAGFSATSYINIEGCYNCSTDEYYDKENKKCTPCNKLPLPLTTPDSQSTYKIKKAQSEDAAVDPFLSKTTLAFSAEGIGQGLLPDSFT
ncbi:mucin-6-like [Protopterus annectens]|uniref:mucin-6-like n=1 Tax=Protopterus annectens TaxID=7888 RepID=UPI001CFC1C09|nr:mucin-6-like [Protopterus annectens]